MSDSGQALQPSAAEAGNEEELDELAMLGVGDTERVLTVAFHPTKQYIVFGCENSTIKVWNVRTKLYSSIVTHPGRVKTARFSHDGQFLVTGASGHPEGNTLAMWACQNDVKDPAEMNLQLFMCDSQLAPGRLEVLHQGDINAVAFAPAATKMGPTLIASGSSDNTVRLWHCPHGYRMTRQTIRNHKAPVKAVEFSSDGKYLFSAGLDGDLWVHRLVPPDLSLDGDVFGGDGADVAEEGEKKGDELEIAPEFKFSHMYTFSTGEPVFDLKAFPGFELVTQVGAPSVSIIGPDRQYFIAVACAKAVLILRIHDGYIAEGPESTLATFLGLQAQQESGRSRFDGGQDINFASRKVNYSQATLHHRIQVDGRIRSIATASISHGSTAAAVAAAANEEGGDVKDDRTSDPNVFEGYLQRKTQSRLLSKHMWRRRWFVANTRTGQLVWYENQEKEGAPKGFLRFELVKSVRARPSQQPDKSRFDIRVYGDGENDVLSLRAESKRERRRWMNVIMQGMETAKPDVRVLTVAADDKIKAYVLQAWERPSASKTPEQAKAQVLVRARYLRAECVIGTHDDNVTSVALPTEELNAKFVEAALLGPTGLLCASASVDQSVRLFKWAIDPTADDDDNDDEASKESAIPFTITAAPDDPTAPGSKKSWVALERPLTQLQLTDRVKVDAALSAARTPTDTVVAVPRRVMLGHPHKADLTRLGLTKEKDLEAESDSDVDFGDDDGNSDPEDETLYMNQLGSKLLGTLAPEVAPDVIVGAQVLPRAKAETTAQRVMRRADQAEDEVRAAEAAAIESGAKHQVMAGQLASFARMAARADEAPERASCEVPGCVVM